MCKWKPKLGETYYFVTHWLRVSKSSWANWSGEKRLLEEGNCFRTEQEAEAKLEKIKAIFKEHQTTEQKLKLTVGVFDREDCPEWAMYAALNADGKVWFFSNKPSCKAGKWNVDYCGIVVQAITLVDVVYDASDWKNSLVERPWKHKRLPDWVTVGAPYYSTDSQSFRNFTEYDLEDVDGLYQLIKVGIYREARCEVLSTDEIEALIGKVLQHTNGDKALVCSYNKKTNLVYMGHYTVTPEELLCYWTLDGKRCGKMFYWSRSSEAWIKP